MNDDRPVLQGGTWIYMGSQRCLPGDLTSVVKYCARAISKVACSYIIIFMAAWYIVPRNEIAPRPCPAHMS